MLNLKTALINSFQKSVVITFTNFPHTVCSCNEKAPIKLQFTTAVPEIWKEKNRSRIFLDAHKTLQF